MSRAAAATATVVPPSYTDVDIHTHRLEALEVDATLATVSLSATETRVEACRLLLRQFCQANNIANLLILNDGQVDIESCGSIAGSDASSIHPYSLLYVSSNHAPEAIKKLLQQQTEKKLLSNVYIVITECRLYPTLVEHIVRACPYIRYWDAVNSSVLNPRVLSAWHTLLHLNTLKLSLLNCMNLDVCRHLLMFSTFNPIQRLLIVGSDSHSRDAVEQMCHVIRTMPFLAHFAYTEIYALRASDNDTRVHLTHPVYELIPHKWAVRANEEANGSLGSQFERLQIQPIGMQALVAEVLV